MKFGMTSLTFKAKSIEETLKIAKKAGVECIEWGVCENHAGSDENVEKIKKLSKDYGIEICSLGSYCKLTSFEDCIETIELAKKLSAPVIRIWAGEKSPNDCDQEYFDMLVENARKMGDEAAKYGIVISFEFHLNTLTETAESAVKFLKAINHKNVLTHWQGIGAKSIEENLGNRNSVKPYLSGIFHVSNYKAGEGYLLIKDAKERVQAFFSDYKDTDFCLLVEFTKGGLEESLISDINALHEFLA